MALVRREGPPHVQAARAALLALLPPDAAAWLAAVRRLLEAGGQARAHRHAARDWRQGGGRAHLQPADGARGQAGSGAAAPARGGGARAADHEDGAARDADGHGGLRLGRPPPRRRRALVDLGRGHRERAHLPQGAVDAAQAPAGRAADRRLHHPALRAAAAAILCAGDLRSVARLRDHRALGAVRAHPPPRRARAHRAARPAAAAPLGAAAARVGGHLPLLALQPGADPDLPHRLPHGREHPRRRAHRLRQDHLRRVRHPAHALAHAQRPRRLRGAAAGARRRALRRLGAQIWQARPQRRGPHGRYGDRPQAPRARSADRDDAAAVGHDLAPLEAAQERAERLAAAH
mmetsp:Transcript_81372/g.244013  ORF Transcript_81372/g.244013 Transcript_81372/m.244013 type:complete len:348 (+) Transcript_81372:1707-2750(+)